MSDTLYLAPEPDEDGLGLSRFISLLGIELKHRSTFSPAPGAPLDHAWSVWQETLFLPHFAPAFVQAFNATSTLQIDEAVKADLKIDAALPAAIRQSSLLAGRPFLEGKSEMRGHREWIRFAERVEQGQSPGHVCVLFAAQSALYHLPLPAAVSAFACFEFQARHATFPFKEMPEDEKQVFSTILKLIPLAVKDKSTENDAGDGTLHAI
ncbi:MAG: hypothetical protein AAF357_09115 [Verrucomicrobiota bacterium]